MGKTILSFKSSKITESLWILSVITGPKELSVQVKNTSFDSTYEDWSRINLQTDITKF